MQEFDAEEDAITGINVTPLVDITLVLLIIFMVTARFIAEPSLGINLPKTSSTARSEPTDRNVFLTMDEKGELFINNAPVAKADLSAKMQQMLKDRPDLNLVLRADRRIPHGDVIEVLDLVRSAGVTQFGIAVEAPAK
jgi:biopolymer transport protein TolR